MSLSNLDDINTSSYQQPSTSTILLFSTEKNNELVQLMDSEEYDGVEQAATDDDHSDIDFYESHKRMDTKIPLWYEDPDFQKLFMMGQYIAENEIWESAQIIHYMILEHVVSNNPENEALHLETRDHLKDIRSDITTLELQEYTGELMQYIEKLSAKIIELSAKQ